MLPGTLLYRDLKRFLAFQAVTIGPFFKKESM